MENRVNIRRAEALVIGSGAAGYNAAVRLIEGGLQNTFLYTEGRLFGTSRNAGSDKQTFYKLSLSGDAKDSVREMAEDLFKGGAVDGEHALLEASLSVRAFMRLLEMGVPFPSTVYGEYMGYKTDHDPHERATSAGPYTSRMMTEALEKRALTQGLKVESGMQLTDLLVKDGKCFGALFLNLESTSSEGPVFEAVFSAHTVLCTGGPAGIYYNTVYPASQTGAAGTAFRAGVRGRNLTEWQFGLASVSPRWNVSGTYMQVLPRFVSTAADGTDEKEFLYDYYRDEGELLSNVFLKGYEWPFDAGKLPGGSSCIDLLCFKETEKGRRIFLDFRENPGKKTPDFGKLSPEARTYLDRAGALFGSPIDRLLKMNVKACEFYLEHGVDLKKEMLEIRLSAQHNNGGLLVDEHYETNISGLFAAGECACTHGVKRPGGSALLAGQAGSLRAAEEILKRSRTKKENETITPEEKGLLEKYISDTKEWILSALKEDTGAADAGSRVSPEALTEEFQKLTDLSAGMLRKKEGLSALYEKTRAVLKAPGRYCKIEDFRETGALLRLRDNLIAEEMYAFSMLHYLENGGLSRGSAVYVDKASPDLEDILSVSRDDGKHDGVTQEVLWTEEAPEGIFREVHPIPKNPGGFETEWALFRERCGL